MPTMPDADAVAGLGLRLLPAHDADPAAVLRFEATNRGYFRRWIPDRGDAYYDLHAVAASLHDARCWWDEGSDRMHVVVDPADEVVARANLVDVAEGRASLGYRVAGSQSGRGIATAAVTDLLASAPHWGISRVHAVTSAVNVASTRVLETCGFTLVRTSPDALELDGARLDALEWEASTSQR
jgi:[ribosomal protein S5]-alanine N-acetyltransferase